jgi:hypothetical protein
MYQGYRAPHGSIDAERAARRQRRARELQRHRRTAQLALAGLSAVGATLWRQVLKRSSEQIVRPLDAWLFASLALDVPLAAATAGAARRYPRLSLMATAKAALGVALATWTLAQPRMRDRMGRAARVAGAAASLGVAGLALPEAAAALESLRKRRRLRQALAGGVY